MIERSRKSNAIKNGDKEYVDIIDIFLSLNDSNEFNINYELFFILRNRESGNVYFMQFINSNVELKLVDGVYKILTKDNEEINIKKQPSLYINNIIGKLKTSEEGFKLNLKNYHPIGTLDQLTPNMKFGNPFDIGYYHLNPNFNFRNYLEIQIVDGMIIFNENENKIEE